MSSFPSNAQEASSHLDSVVEILVDLSAWQRASAIRDALRFGPSASLDNALDTGTLRAALANYWEAAFGEQVPINCLRQIMQAPVKIDVVLQLGQLNVCQDVATAVTTLIDFLRREFESLRCRQVLLFPNQSVQHQVEACRSPSRTGTVPDLTQLLDSGAQFPTIYADPPWRYSNRASNGAAANHYPTMSVDEICEEPVKRLVADNAHLHLWTTNGFLREAMNVIDAWGFTYKSCLVWVKPEIGMGNYWRVSHEYLLLGVRGKLTFQDRTLRSWLESPRTIHSRKPAIVRSLIERASPGPYLELYGRMELPNSQWTVYGNDVEKKWF